MHEEQFGTGEEVLAEGQAITYSSDAAYMLMNEIALPSENICRKALPEPLPEHLRRMRSYMRRKAIPSMSIIIISFA